MPNQDKTPLDKLKDFLNKLFQFESQDLDFGVYKILHYKRKEIKKFIDELLVDKVKEELTILTEEEVKKAKKELKELEENSVIKEWLKAKKENDKETLEFLEKKFEKDIEQYNETKAAAESADVSIETQNQIYNHLTLFFSRYYDKGDFISKRRFGKNEKYVVPYNGEETHFYWANHDQYYIKSSEHFQKYSFTSPKPSDPLKVHFKLTEAQVEQGNVKEDENKYFVLSEKEPELENNELSIFFEYRALTEDEKKEVGTQNKQEKLNESASVKLQKTLSKKPAAAFLWEKKDDETYLLKKLNHYTRKNNYDFFIHKNLKGFLQRELDFYIKSELINVDDLYVQETETHFSRVKHNLKSIKVFKNVADTIIEFLAQIEDFQKKLWEKKKFVLSTEWIITIDKLTGWLGEKEAEPILKEVLKNKNQLEEWKELFDEEIFDDWKKLKIDNLYTIAEQGELGKDESEEKVWKKLPIDTVHFDEDFKWDLLNKLSDKIAIEENSDGLVIHSDNFHGLKLCNVSYNHLIDCIHIDPPYNTATSGFLYKNGYHHSSWLTMMNDSLINNIDLLNSNASLQCHIDENEFENLQNLVKQYYLSNIGPVIWDKRNPMNSDSGLATQHEYIIWATNGTQRINILGNIYELFYTKLNSLIKEEGELNEKVRKKFVLWINDNEDLSGGEKAYRYIDENGKIYQSVSLRAPEPRTDPKFFKPLLHPKTGKPCPVPPNGFSRTPQTLQKMIANNEIIFGEDENVQPRQKVLLKKETQRQFTTIVQDAKKGKADLKPLNLDFPYCHPVSLYSTLIGAANASNFYNILDYFAGSGTTFHATQLLNRDDNGNRKCILIEQGNYVYTVILPRIKKIAYTFDWKEGKPKNGSMNGLGVFLKYQKLEQYEESLENISFNLSEDAQQKALEFEEYIPKYFLEFETKNSRTLVNTEAMENPWDYKLKVWDGYTYDTQKAVDLVDTFNYLIGLHVQKYITKDIDGKRYQFVYGNNNSNKKIVVVWRSIKEWKKKDYEKDRETLKEELKNYEYDLLYINGQAHWENYQPVEHVFKSKMVS